MSKHTKGPWKVKNGAVYTEKEAPIAKMVRDDSALEAGIYPVERDANARLIAAAPEMLEALELAAAYIEEITKDSRNADNGQTIETLNKVIAKAEGRE